MIQKSSLKRICFGTSKCITIEEENILQVDMLLLQYTRKYITEKKNWLNLHRAKTGEDQLPPLSLYCVRRSIFGVKIDTLP